MIDEPRMTDPTPEILEDQRRAAKLELERMQRLNDSLCIYAEGPFNSWPKPSPRSADRLYPSQGRK
jgi:hypothetical protein